MIGRELAQQVLRAVAHELDPVRVIRDRFIAHDDEATDAFAISLGKIAVAMATGLGPVRRGLCLTTRDEPGELPAGWQRVALVPPWTGDERKYARDLLVDIVAAGGVDDRLLFLIANGAEGLLGPELASGKLVRMALSPAATFVMSDDPVVSLDQVSDSPTVPAREGDAVENALVPRAARDCIRAAIDELGQEAVEICTPGTGRLDGDIETIVAAIVERLRSAEPMAFMRVFWGVCHLRGRHHRLALELARYLEGGPWAALILGTDGAAGAYVTPGTMASIRSAGFDPELDDPTDIFEAISAIAIAPSTGMDHGDLVLVG